MSRTRALGSTAAAILGFCRTAEAACPAMEGSTVLAGAEPQARLRFVRRALEEDARHARTWRWVWGGIGTGLTVANSISAALAESRDDRVDSIIAGSSALLIPVLLLVNPPRVLEDEREAFPEGAGEDVCPVLQRAEDILVRDADDEHRRRGAVARLGALGLNLAIGAVLGFGLGHWRAAALQTATGIAISQVQILTHPAGAVDALELYRAGGLDQGGGSQIQDVGPRVEVEVVPAGGGGLLLNVSF